MPRAKRYHILGCVRHITHRCYKKEFLLKFARDRKRWLELLYRAKQRYGLVVLNYIRRLSELLGFNSLELLKTSHSKLSEDDIVFFEHGAKGAHQLYNHSDSPCIYLDLRSTIGIDICEYPDSGKVNILPNIEVFESSSSVDYYKGEENVVAKWPKELLRKS